jgi:hypothetical protein
MTSLSDSDRNAAASFRVSWISQLILLLTGADA